MEEAVHGACGGLGEAARGPMAGRLASVLNWLGAQTLEALSPTRCAGCEAPGQLVCSGCLERLELIDPAWACARCGAPFGRMLCTECYGRTMATDRCLAVAVFQDPLARMIRMYKDAGERRLAEPFAEMLYDAALHAQAEDAERFSGLLARADALVFVPATARAFRRRGFDHMEAIARVLAELSGVPVLDALVKHGAGDQRAWGRLERLMRSHGAYEVVPDAFGALAGARVLLLDDVITTGATVTAAASVLRDAGADGVDALALARVMGPGAG
uniref:ComF family protein n=1 Tax=Collinsella sp. BA40 TaxID=2560852 RepID=UPI002103EE2B|nr:phosphoribosyltransferase family protein [Collinsella sp. BA40]